jgi:hypothetical protein
VSIGTPAYLLLENLKPALPLALRGFSFGFLSANNTERQFAMLAMINLVKWARPLTGVVRPT